MNYELQINPINSWLPEVADYLIISGPCSAESHKQLMQTAIELKKDSRIKIFRAGIWKPRSRPRSFEGVGEQGLQWLQCVRQETGLKVAVEIANPQHLEACLKHNIDVIWLGARTTVNPFSVQEIAHALKGIDIPVLIKNPVSPDLELWIGVIERINQSGIKNIVAVHRGFFTFEKCIYRNNPLWEIPIELKRRCPDLPVICDPSHIAGNRLYIANIAQRALDLAMNGLMVEAHYMPDTAVSDAQQQITPATFIKILDTLQYRISNTSNNKIIETLEELRAKIDVTDIELLRLLSQRLKYVEQIGVYKKNNNITILQLQRWNQIIQHRLQRAKEFNINTEFLMQLLVLIHKESIRIQTEIMNRNNMEENGTL